MLSSLLTKLGVLPKIPAISIGRTPRSPKMRICSRRVNSRASGWIPRRRRLGLNRYAVWSSAQSCSIDRSSSPLFQFPLSCRVPCETMEWLFAAHSISQRSFHDFSSPTHDRGYAGPEPLREHPRLLHPASLAFRTTLQQVTRTAGTRADPRLSGLFDERKETGHRFHSHRDCGTPFSVQDHPQKELVPGRGDSRSEEASETARGPEPGRSSSVFELRQEQKASRHLDHLLCRRPAHLGGHRAHPSRHRRQAHGHPCRAGQREKRSLRDALAEAPGDPACLVASREAQGLALLRRLPGPAHHEKRG